MSPAIVESASALVPDPAQGTPGAAPGLSPGDAATLVVRASWEGGGTLQFPTREQLETALQGKARVLGEAVPAPADAAPLHASGGVPQDARAWRVQLLMPPGEQELPEIPLTIALDGAAPVEAAVPGPTVTIVTVLDETTARQIDEAKADPEALKAEVAQNLAPARGPWELAPRIPWWILLVAGLILAALLLWALRRFLRRRRLAPPPPARLEAPEVVARRRLRELREGAQLTTGRHLEFHVALADILKEYLERRLGADLRERTTEEIRRLFHGSMRSARHVPEIRRDVIAVLSASDLVKFAKAQPLPSESLALVDSVERLVTKTTEAAPAPAPEAGAGPGKEAA